MMYATLALIAAMATMGAMMIPAEATCITTDSTLLSTMEAKIQRHDTETGRADLHEMFTKSYNTMKGNDTYTTSDIKARSDKQGSNWQGPGPNELWRTIYAELDRLETCRANLQTDTAPPVITMSGSATVTINKGDTYTDAGATCADDTDGVISPVSSGIVDTTTAGSYTLSYSCTDTAGNTATQLTRTVTVQSTPISQDTQPAVPKTPVPQTPSDNLISNGSFEAPTVSSWGHITSGTAGLEWTVSGGPIEIQRGILGGASDGSQHIELDSTGSVTISQTISTTSGQSYMVSFDYKARPDTTQSTNGIQVQWNDIDIASGITFGDTWKTHTVTVTGTGSDTLSFMDMGTSDGLGTFLDNVSVVASDVPQTQQGGGPLTGQSIQPGGGGTPTFVLFGIGVPADTITEGGVANVTISTTPAPTTPLDVIVKVSSSSGHVNTANHTISIPTSGSVVFSVQTINTAEHKDGNILIAIQNTNNYLVDGIGAVTIAIKDDPSTLQSNHFSVSINMPRTVYKGDSFTVDIEHNIPSNQNLLVNIIANGTGAGRYTLATLGNTPVDSATISTEFLKVGVNPIVYSYNAGGGVQNVVDAITVKEKAILHAVHTDVARNLNNGAHIPEKITFNAMLRNPTGATGGSYWIIWYVNDTPQTNHNDRTPKYGAFTASNWFVIHPQNKPTSHTDSPLVYNVYATLVNPDGSIIYDKTETKTFKFNPPPPPDNEPEPTGIAKHYKYAVLWSDGMFAMRYTAVVPWLDGSNIEIGEKDGSGKINLAGAYTWEGHRGYGSGHEYTISKSKVCDIDALSKPYVFVRGDGGVMYRVGPLYMYEFTSSTCP